MQAATGLVQKTSRQASFAPAPRCAWPVRTAPLSPALHATRLLEGHSGAGLGRSTAVAAVLLAALALRPQLALAEDLVAAGTRDTSTTDSPTRVYFGNGCFWGRQKEFVDVEKSLGRAAPQISSVVGYAGGQKAGRGGKVCYYYGPEDSVYERLGHAEVVQLELHGDQGQTQQQMVAFADAYFKQFRKTPFGMMRLDPQDSGPGYRNVVGIPGGVSSPLFKVLKERNVNGMDLVPGDGNTFQGGRPTEDDKLNTVYIVDSNKLPFYRAEVYHQFHNGIGKAFPAQYTRDQKRIAEETGRIASTGCPEGSFSFF